MKMRELEQRTGVHRETIRVYLRHGLLPQPMRPKRNVAEYAEAHVRGILAIRELQRHRRLSLAQIRRVLEGDGSAVRVEAGAFPHLDTLVAARMGVDDAMVPLSVVGSRNAHAEGDARALARVGAVQLSRRRGQLLLNRVDAQLVGLWGDMRKAGFTEALSFDPEVAEMYVEAASALARREVSEFLSRVAAPVGEEAAADMSRAALTHMLDFFGLLRLKAVVNEIRRQTAGNRRRAR